jgi:predicted nucleic acid-binding protein
MMYLLDTCVVSELRKPKTDSFSTTRPLARKVAKADPSVVAWASGIPQISLYLSAVCVMELELGTLLMERRDMIQGRILRNWIDRNVLPSFAGRVLVVDTTVAIRCASLHVPNPCSYRDSLIAATALVHGMTVVTRNVAHFEPSGVAVLNPWVEPNVN